MIFATVLPFAILGLLVGSFLNVVILRTAVGEQWLRGCSACVACSHRLAWYDNLPLMSFALLGGRCRYCRTRISWQYPLVELLTAALFVLVGWGYAVGVLLPLSYAMLLLLVLAGSVVVGVYDLRYMMIPMRVMWATIGAALLAVGTLAVLGGSSYGWSMFAAHCATGAVLFGVFWLLSWYSKETWMGYGDAYVALVLGLILGPINSAVGLLVAFCTGAVVGVALITLFGRTSKSQVPFAPFLFLGLYALLAAEVWSPGAVAALFTGSGF